MKVPRSLRVWFIVVSVMLWIGIYLTGFSSVSWLLYLPAAGFAVAAITGFCPSQLGIFKMFDVKIKEIPDK